MAILKEKRALLFNIAGVVIVAFWLSMIFLLIKKENFIDQGEDAGNTNSMVAITSDRMEWKEIFLGDKKVGYSVSRVNPFEEGFLVQEDLFLKLNLMGMARAIHTVTRSLSDKDFRLVNFYFKMTSGIVTFAISGRVEGRKIIIQSGSGKGEKAQEIVLEKEPMIGAGIGYFFQSREIKVGDDFLLPIFDPSTMAERDARFRVAGMEKVEINNIIYESFRLEADMWGNRMTIWVDREGSTLKEEGFMGLRTVRSNAANAPLNIEMGGSEDFYERAAVPLDRIIPDPSGLKSLTLRVEGLDNMPQIIKTLDAGRQSYRDGILVITREDLSPIAGYQDRDREPPSSLKPLLATEYNIETDSEKIIKTAKGITGGEKDPLKAAKKLMDWVYENIEKKPVISIPSALEVLRTRTGDCNEHATLLTALLRASGIPARISVGLVYNQNKFLYHAWTEAYTGQWVSMDATLAQMPADVGHVSLMKGNLERQVEIAGLIGKIKLKLIDYRHD